MAMGADYSFDLISIETYAPQFIGYNKLFLGSVTAQFAWSVGSHTRLSSQFTTMIKALSNRYEKGWIYFLPYNRQTTRIFSSFTTTVIEFDELYFNNIFTPSLTWMNLSEIVGLQHTYKPFPADFKN